MMAHTAAPVPVEPATIDAFAQQLRGELITRMSPDYDEARKVYNGMIDRRPLLIARCADVADVIASVNFARDNHLLLAIRGGGHNGPGLGVCDDGLVIDLSQVNGIRVDPIARTAPVEGGALLSGVDHATHPFGLAVPAGMIASTGVGGLTLGGGIGHLSRKSGLTIDHLLEADIVLADGSLVVANKDQHADLFWAIRGGGGNFGVVVSFLFSLPPVSIDYAGPMFWTLDKSTDVMKWFLAFLPTMPDELSGFFAFLVVPPGPPFPEELHGQTMCGIVWCYTGPLDKAEEVFAPIRAKFGKPALDWVGPIPHPALLGMFDPLYTPGLQWYWKTDFFKTLPDEAIAQFVAHGSSLPTGLSTMHLYPLSGAASRVANDATAWANRDAKWSCVIIGVSPDPADNEKMTRWARDFWSAVHPYSSGGAYINFMMDEGADRVRATYGKNYDRLAAIKAKYDPDNLFRVNQNIKPA